MVLSSNVVTFCCGNAWAEHLPEFPSAAAKVHAAERGSGKPEIPPTPSERATEASAGTVVHGWKRAKWRGQRSSLTHSCRFRVKIYDVGGLLASRIKMPGPRRDFSEPGTIRRLGVIVSALDIFTACQRGEAGVGLAWFPHAAQR